MILMTERIWIEHKNFKNLFGFETDYRATVGALKKVLKQFDDDLPIGIVYDSEFAYCDINGICLGKDGLVRLIGD